MTSSPVRPAHTDRS